MVVFRSVVVIVFVKIIYESIEREKKMKKKYLVFMIVAMLISSALSGCGKVAVDVVPENNQNENGDKTSVETVLENSETSAMVLDMPERDKPIPAYELTFLDGTKGVLDQYQGNVVVVSFFTTWCSYCKKELPELEKISKEIENLTVLGIDVAEDDADVIKFVDEMGVTFPVYSDNDMEISNKFLVNSFPTLLFISPEGILIGTVPGYIGEEQLKEYINYARDYKPAK